MTAPVLLIVTVPPFSSVRLVTVRGAAVLVRLMLPLVVLVALKLLTVLAPPSVVPVAELVVKRPVVPKLPPVSVMLPAEVALILPEPVVTAAFTARVFPPPVTVRLMVSVVVPVTAAPRVKLPFVAVRLMALAAVASVIAPEVTMLPVLLTVIPPPVSAIPVMVNGAAVLVSLMLPLVLFVALNVEIVFEAFRVVPPTELAVTVPAESLMAPLPDSLIVPPLVSDRAPLSMTAPVTAIVSAAVLPVFTLVGAAEAPPVPVNVKLFVPFPSVTEMEVTSTLGIVIVLVPPPVTSIASLPVVGAKSNPPVSVKV